MRPVFVKIPMDINEKEISLVVRGLVDAGVDGVVVAGPLSMSKNSLLQLPGMKDDCMGMLTGALVKEQTLDLVRQVYEKSNGQLTVIGCGSVFTAEDAWALIKAGARMIQIDNATLTFAGPTCVSEIHKGLLQLLKQNNFSNITEAVGLDFKKQQEGSVNTVGSVEATPDQGSVSVVPEPVAQNSQTVPPSMSETVHSEVPPTANSSFSSEQH